VYIVYIMFVAFSSGARHVFTKEEETMLVTRETKELLGQLVEQLGAGRVVRGLLRYPTRTESYGLGATDLEYLLSRFIGEEVIVIIMPLTDSEGPQDSPPGAHRAEGREDYCEGGSL